MRFIFLPRFLVCTIILLISIDIRWYLQISNLMKNHENVLFIYWCTAQPFCLSASLLVSFFCVNVLGTGPRKNLNGLWVIARILPMKKKYLLFLSTVEGFSTNLTQCTFLYFIKTIVEVNFNCLRCWCAPCQFWQMCHWREHCFCTCLNLTMFDHEQPCLSK